jgi:hypothetical protein
LLVVEEVVKGVEVLEDIELIQLPLHRLPDLMQLQLDLVEQECHIEILEEYLEILQFFLPLLPQAAVVVVLMVMVEFL